MDTFEKRARERRKREKREDKLARRKERSEIKQQRPSGTGAPDVEPSEFDRPIDQGPESRPQPEGPST